MNGLPDAPGIYLLTHQKTGGTYVGSASNLRVRVGGHLANFRGGYNIYGKLADVVKEHGPHFEASILEQVPESELFERERHWIETLRPTLNGRMPPRVKRRRPCRTMSVAAKVDGELFERFKAMAVEDQRSLSFLIEDAMREYVERHDAPAPSDPAPRRKGK